MRHSAGLITTAEALQLVFLSTVQSTLTHSPRATRNPRPTHPQCLRRPITSTLSRPHQYRHASTSRMGGYMAFTDDIKTISQRPDRPPRDEEIKSSKVYMVRPSDQGLSEPIPTYQVLNSRERDDKGRPTQFLQEVAGLNVEEGRYYPICRMFDKKATRERELAKRKAGKEKRFVTKQLECSWTISDNDLGHRLGRLKEFLEKGWRVEILFGTKRKGWMGRREASAEESASVLAKIRTAVGEVEGAKELREMQGKEGGEAMLSVEGRPKK